MVTYMINKLKLYISDSLDPYLNMAFEKRLTLDAGADECILYLWRNERTVVVGRNQNCWAECRVSELEADGGHLARRLSGGGAVYHDAGNLNFTFACSRENYDVSRQCAVIAAAVRSFGIETEVSGRNDILADGYKFSGNAFWRFGENHYHHGTILIKSDKDEMSKYLCVPADKLKANGIASVRSRVVNLCELCGDINIGLIKEALCRAFGEIYGLPVIRCRLPEPDAVAGIRAEFDSPDWKYGRTPAFTHKLSGRYPWGGVTFYLDVREGRIFDCGISSDALDTGLIDDLPALLRGCRYNAAEMSGRLPAADERTADLSALFTCEI